MDKNEKSFLVDRSVTPKPNVEYVSMDLTLIRCKDFCKCTSRIIRYIEDNINALNMIQVTRPLGLRLRLR